jgi:NADH-quinone oxidoreductase subunit J
MTPMQITFLLATVLGAVGIWLSLPGHGARLRMVGLIAGLASLGLFASQAPSLGSPATDYLFWILAGVTVIAAAGTISFRNPVYSAIWFALSLLGTAALFFFQGSQFLAVATVVVYAGAILVTFLFVLMLAQPRGQAAYDRVSWEGLLSATAGAVLVGVLTMTLASLLTAEQPVVPAIAGTAAGQQVDRSQEILTEEHMAHLGRELFSRYLIAVEVAGTLLLVGLVGAVAIAAQHRRLTGRPSTSASPPIEPLSRRNSDLPARVEEAARGNISTPGSAGTRA